MASRESQWFGPSVEYPASPLESYLVPPPRVGEGDVCPNCRSWRHARFPMCSNCMEIEHDLGRVYPVIPISIYRRQSFFRNWLKFYKEDGAQGSSSYARNLTEVFDRFVRAQSAALLRRYGRVDLVVPVPSSGRQAPSPLSSLVTQVVWTHLGVPTQSIEYTSSAIGHRTANGAAFKVPSSLSGRRALIVDDVYTTGAHAQSAAYAVGESGAEVVAILVLARRVNPEFNEASQRVWDRQASKTYRFQDLQP